MASWALQDAKGRFSEVVDRARRDGPQIVTRRGTEAVVIVAAEQFRHPGNPQRPAALLEPQ